jgi:formylglycine-generating enzyme required for sulfatase activity
VPKTKLGSLVNGFWNVERTRLSGFPRQFAHHPTAEDDPTAEDAPVDWVQGQAATEFCAKLTEIDRDAGILSKDWEYRLPIETEWDYACRAGTSGAAYGPLDSIAWHFGNADQRPHPVGEKAPNPWGFYDMLGNVWEMCQDWFSVKRQL